MPQAKKSTRSRSSSSTRRSSPTSKFKEPAAVKRLTKSLETAQGALGDLGKDVGRDAGVATRDLQKQLRTGLTGTRRDLGKLVRALQRDFDQAQKKLSKASSRSTTRARSTSGRGASTRSASTRSASTRSASTRSASTRSASTRSASTRSAGSSRSASGRTASGRTTRSRSTRSAAGRARGKAT